AIRAATRPEDPGVEELRTGDHGDERDAGLMGCHRGARRPARRSPHLPGIRDGVAAAEGSPQGAAAWQRPLNDWIAREQNPSQPATSGPDPSAWTQLQQTTFSLTDDENNLLRAVRTVATLPCRRQSSSTPDRPARGSGAGALPGRSRRPVQVVEPRAVVPQDLRLRLVRHALERDELLDRVWEQPVRVRIVGRDDDRVVADRLHDLAQHLLVRVGRHVALTVEVLAGQRADLHLGSGAELLPRFIESPEPPRKPPAGALEE